jgi:hypothetical protein
MQVRARSDGSSVPEPRLDSAALIELAAESGHAVTDRALEDWRYRGLIPRPARAGSPARWLYPPGVDEQLLALLRWREKTRDAESLRIALWVEGFAIETAAVRKALSSFVEGWQAMVRRELGEAGIDEAELDSAAIDALAHKLARMRSRSPIPKVVRMSLAERTRAYGYAIAVELGHDDEITRRAKDADDLARMLGLRRGRTGGLLNTIDGAPHLRDSLLAPHDARVALESATDEELELIRRVVHTLLTWLPTFLSLMIAEEGDKARDFATLAQLAVRDAPGELLATAVIAVLTSLRRKAPPSREIQDQLAAFVPALVNLELLMSVSDGERQAAWERLSVSDRRQVLEARRRGELHRGSNG